MNPDTGSDQANNSGSDQIRVHNTVHKQLCTVPCFNIIKQYKKLYMILNPLERKNSSKTW